jgi:hypothetical protein
MVVKNRLIDSGWINRRAGPRPLPILVFPDAACLSLHLNIAGRPDAATAARLPLRGLETERSPA